MTSHSKQEHPFMKHKATFYILVVLVSKYNLTWCFRQPRLVVAQPYFI